MLLKLCAILALAFMAFSMPADSDATQDTDRVRGGYRITLPDDEDDGTHSSADEPDRSDDGRWPEDPAGIPDRSAGYDGYRDDGSEDPSERYDDESDIHGQGGRRNERRKTRKRKSKERRRNRRLRKDKDRQTFAAFSVRRAAEQFKADENKSISFNKVDLNDGSFNARTGEFRAPDAGIYFLAWHALCHFEYPGYCRVALIKKSHGREEQLVHSWGTAARVAAAAADESKSVTRPNNVNNQYLAWLERGDIVSLRVTKGRIYDNAKQGSVYTTFMGYSLPFGRYFAADYGVLRPPNGNLYPGVASTDADGEREYSNTEPRDKTSESDPFPKDEFEDGSIESESAGANHQ